MKAKVKIFSILIILLIIGSSFAEDWPQYLGPNRDSTSAETGILHSWPEGGPEVLWTVSLGRGFGGPVVKDGKIYLLDRDDEVGDNLRCYDLSNGDELWNFGYDAPGTVQFPGSRSVPTVDGDYVYSCGHNGDLYCININTHEPVWNKNIWTEYGGGRVPTWAITQCPLVYGDLLIVASQAPDAGVVAYDKLTGDVNWTTPFLGPVGYVSPAIVNIGGEAQVVMITASAGRLGRGGGGSSSGGVFGLNPLNGEVLWNYPDFQCMIPVPSALDVGEDRVFITGGYNAGGILLKVEQKSDDSYGVTALFRNSDFNVHTQTPILCNGYFYGQCTTNERSDGLICMSIDGDTMWKTGRDPAFNKGGMILVDGLILATDGESILYLIEPDPSEFKPIASAELLVVKPGEERMAARFGNQNWGPIALSDGKLLIRDQTQLKCIAVR